MKILFLCTHNACRSILSEAITRGLATGRIDVASAGTSPAAQVHPLTLRYLHNHGYDTGDLRSKSIAAVRSFGPDVVVTVCDSAARESCPVWLGKVIRVHWVLPDPSRYEGNSEGKAEAFARVMATIEKRIGLLLEQPFENMSAEQLTTVLDEIGGQG